MNKVISLSKVFIKDFYQSLPIFDKEKSGFNKRSIFFWMILLLFIAITYLSHKMIKFLIEIGQERVFLDLYFLVIGIILLFQTIIICVNVFFFSKDIEKVFYMPIKPVELLVAKLATLLTMMYATEAVCAVVPFTLFGLMTQANLLFYIWELLTLAVFPILIATFISILTLIIMRSVRFIKNKNLFQFAVTFIMVAIVCVLEYVFLQTVIPQNYNIQELEEGVNLSENLQSVNNYLLIINPSANILADPASLEAIANFAKILLINILSFAVFVLIGKFTYLKDVLKSMSTYTKKQTKKIKEKELKKSSGIAKAYIQKDLKLLIREPIFFMQCCLPIIIVLITLLGIGYVIFPVWSQIMENEEIKNAIQSFSFNMESACPILIALQVLFSLSTLSLTAISREGKNAKVIKYIPVELYKQFLYKSFPQIVLNLCITIVALGVIWYVLPQINWVYILMLFVIATVINFINSYLMLIVDLRRPNLDWNTEYAVVKKSDNKFFQYAFMIVNVLILMYIATFFKETNVMVALVAEFLIYLLVFIILDRCIKKWQSKLFNKIN